MDIFRSISLGFDVATAVSIIGAAIAFVLNMKRENKKKIGEERENERVKRLASILDKYREIMFKLFDSLYPQGNNKENANPRNLVFNMYNFLKKEALPTIVMYSNKEDFEGIVEMMDLTEDFYNKVNKNQITDDYIEKYLNKMIDLEGKMILRMRELMLDESNNESKKILKRYKYIEYGFGDEGH